MLFSLVVQQFTIPFLQLKAVPSLCSKIYGMILQLGSLKSKMRTNLMELTKQNLPYKGLSLNMTLRLERKQKEADGFRSDPRCVSSAAWYISDKTPEFSPRAATATSDLEFSLDLSCWTPWLGCLMYACLWSSQDKVLIKTSTIHGGNSLVVQWLRLCILTVEGLGSTPGGELRSHKLCDVAKKKTEKRKHQPTQDFSSGNRHPKFSCCTTSTEVSAPSLCWPQDPSCASQTPHWAPVLPGGRVLQWQQHHHWRKPSYDTVTLSLHVVYKTVIYF